MIQGVEAQDLPRRSIFDLLAGAAVYSSGLCLARLADVGDFRDDVVEEP